MKLKKIGILHYSAPPVVGGVEMMIQHHAQLLVEAGSEVTILAGKGGLTDGGINMAINPLLDSSSPEILAIKKELDQGLVPDTFSDIKDKILTFLEQHGKKFDILIAHNICSLHKNLPLTAALFEYTRKEKAPPLIAWHHDLAWKNHQYRNELYDRWPWNLLKKSWHDRSQIHVAVSDMRQKEVAELFNIRVDSISVIPSGLDWASFLRLDERTVEIISRFGLMDADPLFLLPARITRRKNIELAIKIISQLKDQYPLSALVITGPPGPHNPSNKSYFRGLIELRESLQLGGGNSQRIYPRVVFLAEHDPTFLPNRVIEDLYRCSDALLFPSKQEGFGIPILEAGLTGIPIFCSDIPPFRETAHDMAHFFDPDEHPDTIAMKITRTLESDTSSRLKRHVKQNYSWEKIFQNKILPLIEVAASK